MSEFRLDHAGMGQMLRMREMEMAMLQVANEIKARAEGLAPVGTRRDEHPGRYRASFKTRSGISYTAPGRYGGGRAEAVVYNDSPEAIYVEFGHFGAEPYRVLARAAFINRIRR